MRDNVTAEDGESSNAISLFGQAANANDFPVLKAFQEYLEAEQAKARKRMLGLSIFFVVLLVAVVVTFTVVVTSIVGHNRELSDRLLDVAFRERQAPVIASQPIVQPQPPPVVAPAQDTGIKPILEKLDALAAAMVARQQQALQLQQPTPVVVTTAPAPVASSVPAESVESQQMKETIKRQQAELEAERNRLREAEEKLRKAEIERHRRRLYPEYYAQQDAAARRLQELPQSFPEDSEPAPKNPPAPPPQKPTTLPAPAVSQPQPQVADRRQADVSPRTAGQAPTPLTNLKPIDYFAQGEDENLSELVKQKSNRQKQPARPDVPQAKPKSSDSQKTATPPPSTPPASSAKKEPPSPTKAAPAPSASQQDPAAKKKTEPPAKTVQPPPPKRPEAATKQKAAPPSATKTETLDVGTSSDNSIPWLIEERDL